MPYLRQIQTSVQQIADATASALDIEVTVVDSGMMRIAGTGRHKETVGRRVTGSSVFQKVIQHRKEYIITDVSTNDECDRCDERRQCLELAQLCCPITIGTEVIGVIGFIAFSPEMQAEICRKNKRLLTFMRKMAEFIATKAAERDSFNRLIFTKKQLETVLNFVTEGIVTIDRQAHISNMNYAAEKMLRVKASDVIGLNINDVFPGTPITEVLFSGAGFTSREINVWYGGINHRYLINAKPMLADGIIHGVVATFKTYNELNEINVTASEHITFSDIIGSSESVLLTKNEAQKAASASSTVLITGESGTGKELFAQAIHYESERYNKPFIAVNCAAIPDNLLESELFGYNEGAFTGAKKGGKPGKFELANGGTIFLDEIGDMPLMLQAKILRVLQEKGVERVGGIKTTNIDVRVIAATNKDLEKLVKEGKFREDLYYRLNVFPLRIPSLRERIDDVLPLAEHFLHKYSLYYKRNISKISADTKQILLNYTWPGNIRELENSIECAVIRSSDNTIQVNDLSPKFAIYNCLPNQESNENYSEKQAIAAALQIYGNTVEGKQKAAQSLGIGIATLYRKIKKYSL